MLLGTNTRNIIIASENRSIRIPRTHQQYRTQVSYGVASNMARSTVINNTRAGMLCRASASRHIIISAYISPDHIPAVCRRVAARARWRCRISTRHEYHSREYISTVFRISSTPRASKARRQRCCCYNIMDARQYININNNTAYTRRERAINNIIIISSILYPLLAI